MNPLRFLLGVVTLLVLCGASRGNEWRRMPVGPVEEPSAGQPAAEAGKTVATAAPFTRGIQTGNGWTDVNVTGPKTSNETTRAKDAPSKDERQQNFPRIRSFFGRFRGQGY